MLLSLVNGLWTDMKDATFGPGHQTYVILHTFLLLSSKLNAKNSAKNSKEVSEYDSTNKMPSRKTESLLILEFYSLPNTHIHITLLPLTADLDFIRAGNTL